jgi:long-subunit acyl-CoA synthetase (AMP-forming)
VLAGSTAAACPPSLQTFYAALAVPFRDFFAMTETGIVAVQRPDPLDRGTLGVAVPGCELAVAEDGEVVVRAAHAPRRYHGRAHAGAETYADADGWIHTGDLGALDAEGRLRLIGRKKEMLVPEHGHNVAPVELESALRDGCPRINQICVVGDGRPHLGALIVLDHPEAAEDPEACAEGRPRSHG